MNIEYSTICEFDENGERRIHLWTGEDYSILDENLEAEYLPSPGTVIVLINGTDSRSVILRPFNELKAYLDDVFSEDFQTWSDLLDFEQEKETARNKKYERAQDILFDINQHLSSEDLGFVEQAIYSHIE